MVDVILFTAFVVMLWTSAVVQFIFPPGTQAAGWLLWGMGFDGWSVVRFVSLAVFTLTTLVHLILQWSWVCNFVASRLAKFRGSRVNMPDGIKTLYGVGTLIGVLSVLGILLAIAEVSIKPG